MRGAVQGNPSSGVIKQLFPARKRAKAKRKQSIRAFTQREVQLILANTSERYYAPMLSLFSTGVRPGEFLGLNWDCVSLEGREIGIRRSFRGDRLREYTKTGEERVVPIDDKMVAELEKLKKGEKHRRLKGKRSNAVFFLQKVSGSARIASGMLTKELWTRLA
jgi:integrase